MVSSGRPELVAGWMWVLGHSHCSGWWDIMAGGSSAMDPMSAAYQVPAIEVLEARTINSPFYR